MKQASERSRGKSFLSFGSQSVRVQNGTSECFVSCEIVRSDGWRSRDLGSGEF
ncbi:hypothetical protein KFK09_017266 [Dendrobium nobile]|uniref:Uncharacterized protein n=1 Tax=Dendrobium nobile TaxID=94219 RepID=A0A8T3B0X4_DENNO|nr:hypothetical protein KFK09_017266 [Dendrobium nobile]